MHSYKKRLVLNTKQHINPEDKNLSKSTLQYILKLSYVLYLTLLAISKESTWLNAIGFTSWSVVVLAWPSCKYLMASSTMESSSAKCLFSFYNEYS